MQNFVDQQKMRTYKIWGFFCETSTPGIVRVFDWDVLYMYYFRVLTSIVKDYPAPTMAYIVLDP